MNESCKTFFEENVAALQNDSKGVEKFQHLSFCATCVLFEPFWRESVRKRSTKKTELKTTHNQVVIRGIFADFG